MTLRQWTDAFELPSLDAREARHAIADSAGIYIALRSGDNRIVGSAALPGRDALTLRRTAGSAFSGVLADSTVRRLMERSAVSIGSELSLELEVAGPLRPLIGRSAAQIGMALEPGIDGLAMRRGGDVVLLFPAQMRRRDSTTNLEGNLARLARELGLNAQPINELRKRHGISVYRFRTLHLVQSAPSDNPRATHRGLQVVGTAEVDRAAVAHLADALAGHLLTRNWPGDEPVGMLGDYHPLRDRYHPLVASPRDQALTAVALLRYAEAPGIDPQQSRRAADGAATLLRQLNAVGDVETDPVRNPAAAAMIVAAAARLPDARIDQAVRAVQQRALQPLMALAELDDQKLSAELNVLSPSQRAMIALALVRHHDAEAVPLDAERVRRLLNAVWQSAPKPQHVAMMPWLGWAELEFAERNNRPPAHVDDMMRLRAALWTQQVQRGASGRRMTGDAGGDWVDLIGGFVLTGEEALWGGRPTAQSVRPAALLATMLRHDAFAAPSVLPTASRSHRRTMRFLMQLSVREADLWMMPRPDRAEGGLRASTWQHHQPVAAQAMGLLTAAETLISLEHLGDSDQAGWPGL